MLTSPDSNDQTHTTIPNIKLPTEVSREIMYKYLHKEQP